MIEVFVDSSVLIEGLKRNPEAVEIMNTTELKRWPRWMEIYGVQL